MKSMNDKAVLRGEKTEHKYFTLYIFLKIPHNTSTIRQNWGTPIYNKVECKSNFKKKTSK